MSQMLKKNTMIQFFSQQVRESRVSLEQKTNCLLYLDSTQVKLLNISESGLAFHSLEKVSNQKHTLKLIFNNAHFELELKGDIVWERKVDEGYYYGFHFTHEFLPEGFLEAIDKVSSLKSNIGDHSNDFSQVTDEFKLITYEISSYLGKVKKELDLLEEELSVQSELKKNSYRRVVSSYMGPDFVVKLKLYSKQLDAIFSSIQDKNMRKIYIDFFRNKVGEYYSSSPFIGRALAKPRGYAGDYEMMNQIYRDNYEGNSFFIMLMHSYGINEDSSQSVKYRRKYLLKKIQELSTSKDQFIFGSLASGPAAEIIDLLESLEPEDSKKFKIVLMDQDIEALLNAKRNISQIILKKGLLVETLFLPLSVKSVIENTEEAQVLKEISFDLIYTAGLFDYLTQPVAKMLTKNLITAVKSEGHLIIGNFHPSNYSGPQ